MSEIKKETLKRFGKVILTIFVLGGVILENFILFSKFGENGILFNSPFILIELATLAFILSI